MYYYKGNLPRIAEEGYTLDPSLTAIYSKALPQYPLWHLNEMGWSTAFDGILMNHSG